MAAPQTKNELMSDTVCITIRVEHQDVKDELIALLLDTGFYAFEEKDAELVAYTDEISFAQMDLAGMLDSYGLAHTQTAIAPQNWNEVWESNFEAVVVDDFCTIRAAFHQPDTTAKYEILITPKMSFGTGHHATTYLMLTGMRHLDFANKTVADFGTGTGVLSILAEKMGSSRVWAADNDECSIDNAAENIKANRCQKIVLEKTEGFNTTLKFDIILANINRNVIVNNLEKLAGSLGENGLMLISGLLKEDESDMRARCTASGFEVVSVTEKSNWISLLCRHRK